MKQCSTCTRAWPLYLDKSLEEGCSMEEACRRWCMMAESSRHVQYTENVSAETKVLSKLVTRRSLSAYQLFLRSHMKTINSKSFVEKVKLSASAWNALSEEQKDVYREEGVQIQAERQAQVRGLSPRRRRILRKLRRELREKRRAKSIHKRCNSFMLYLRDRWNDEKRREDGLRYRPLMYEVSREWAVLHPSIKRLYRERFLAEST